MAGDATSPGVPQFKDRSTGLLISGAIQILMEGLCAILIPLMIASMMLGANGMKSPVKLLIPAIAMYAMGAIVFVTLGIGSIRTRRWARALTLVGAWTALLVGTYSFILMLFWFPGVFSAGAANEQKAIPAEGRFIFFTVFFLFMGVVYIAIPGAFVLFYGRDDVRRTCEFRDPHIRWTDKTPLPVLALSMMLAFGAVSMLSSFSYGPVMPVFGMLIKGFPAAAIIIACFGLFAYLAWGTYKLRRDAWWITLVTIIVFGLSTMITFLFIDLAEFYLEMGMPQDQIDMMKKSGMLQGIGMPLAMGVVFVTYAAYVLGLRRYFFPAVNAGKS